MHQTLRTELFSGTLQQRLNNPQSVPAPNGIALYWLGQAGFVIDFAGSRLLIDPYLSDSLADKYRGTTYPHTRLMPAPIEPDDFGKVDFVLCTHRHTDHMDPGTLQPIAKRFPGAQFIVPAASVDEAIKRCGVDLGRLIPANVGEKIALFPDCFVSPVASAHETIDIDSQGHYEWLGYVIDAGPVRLYHSGDCVPYQGLEATLAGYAPDVALLPVNGRDAQRSGNGVPGNFTLDEAIALAKNGRAKAMIAHHYGLFDFNTISAEMIDQRVAQENALGFEMVRAQTGRAWHVAGRASGDR
jgi:L-ascorbate metabolism protein UlaG (beta-lactamase superfamily)